MPRFPKVHQVITRLLMRMYKFNPMIVENLKRSTIYEPIYKVSVIISVFEIPYRIMSKNVNGFVPDPGLRICSFKSGSRPSPSLHLFIFPVLLISSYFSPTVDSFYKQKVVAFATWLFKFLYLLTGQLVSSHRL